MKECTQSRREADLEVKSQKHLMFGALLEVEMLKKCMLSWCEAPVEVKSVKN